MQLVIVPVPMVTVPETSVESVAMVPPVPQAETAGANPEEIKCPLLTIKWVAGVRSVVPVPPAMADFKRTRPPVFPVEMPGCKIKSPPALLVAPLVAPPACTVRELPAVSAVVCRSIPKVRAEFPPIPKEMEGAATHSPKFPEEMVVPVPSIPAENSKFPILI
ncbi:MAG: hypothetical protein A2139_14145 [Desulfobacca sp. RBG_16_60_12]|nr:MAG: hypothetical protein A2139_14145 [Desulfobacca sp. RBG_16_60_12]